MKVVMVPVWKEGNKVFTSVLRGSRDETVVREPTSHQYGPGSILVHRHMWVEFVVGSRLAPRVFPPGSLVFLPP